MARPVVLAIDCSTTASKAVAFDLEGRALAETRQYLHLSRPREGWFEQDPEEWWSTSADALAALTPMLLGVQPVGICITHQRESFVCVDERGAPVRPGILWLDVRATQQVWALGSADVHRRTGKPPSPVPSLYKLAWLKEREPTTLQRTATVMDVHGFIAQRLTGRRATSWASADSTGLVDLVTKKWLPDLVEMAGLGESQLPELVAPGALVGTLTESAARRTGVPAGTPVIAGAGDGQCAGLGTGAAALGAYYVNAGTSLSLGLRHAEPNSGAGYRTFASPVPGAYDLETLVPAAGLSIAWLVETVSDTATPEELAMAAEEVPPGSRDLVFVPEHGARGPTGPNEWPTVTAPPRSGWTAGAPPGVFVGLTEEHGPAEMYRAIVEGLAFEQRLLLEGLPPDRPKLEQLGATGGVVRSGLFAQILSDVLEVPVHVTRQREGTALGAAMIAAASEAVARYDSLESASAVMTRASEIRLPHTSSSVRYAEAFEAYRARRSLAGQSDSR